MRAKVVLTSSCDVSLPCGGGSGGVLCALFRVRNQRHCIFLLPFLFYSTPMKECPSESDRPGCSPFRYSMSSPCYPPRAVQELRIATCRPHRAPLPWWGDQHTYPDEQTFPYTGRGERGGRVLESSPQRPPPPGGKDGAGGTAAHPSRRCPPPRRRPASDLRACRGAGERRAGKGKGERRAGMGKRDRRDGRGAGERRGGRGKGVRRGGGGKRAKGATAQETSARRPFPHGVPPAAPGGRRFVPRHAAGGQWCCGRDCKLRSKIVEFRYASSHDRVRQYLGSRHLCTYTACGLVLCSYQHPSPPHDGAARPTGKLNQTTRPCLLQSNAEAAPSLGRKAHLQGTCR